MLWENSIIILKHEWWKNDQLVKKDLIQRQLAFDQYIWLFGILIEIKKIKLKKIKPVLFCWLFWQEMRMGKIPCWAEVLFLMFYLIGNLTLTKSTWCQARPISCRIWWESRCKKNLNPCLIGCLPKGWVAILEFEEYRVCLF